MNDMLMETYLRQQVDKGEYGVAIIQAQIALDIANYIEKHRQPTIEPERKKGKWIVGGIEEEESHLGSRWYECNLCHMPGDRQDNFCRGCGADMRGET